MESSEAGTVVGTNTRSEQPNEQKAKKQERRVRKPHKPAAKTSTHTASEVAASVSSEVGNTQASVPKDGVKPASQAPSVQQRRRSNNNNKPNKEKKEESTTGHQGESQQQRPKATGSSTDKSEKSKNTKKRDSDIKPLVNSKSGSDGEKKKEETGGRSSSGGGKRGNNGKWWSSIHEIDPITHEPISSLKYPPFPLYIMDDTKERVIKTHYFDGAFLAQYITSTGNFINPNTRQELTYEECNSLDEYLASNKLKRYNVSEAFTKKSLLSSSSSGNDNTGINFSDASVIANSLFQYPRYQRPSRRNQEGVQFSNVDGLSRQSSGQRISIDDEEAFPSISGGHRPAASVTPPPPPASVPSTTNSVQSWRMRTGAPGSLPMASDFPSLGQTSASTAEPRETWGSRLASSTSVRTSPIRESHKTESVVSMRPKLNLKPRSVPLNQVENLAASSASASSIFGNAKPREVTLKSRGVDWKEAESEKAKKMQLEKIAELANSASSSSGSRPRNFLCPYFPDMLDSALKLGVSFVAQLESTLREFIQIPDKNLVPDLEPKSKNMYKFMKDLCIYYYGLEVTTLDGGKRIAVSKTPGVCFIPEVSIARALIDYNFILDEALKGDSEYFSLTDFEPLSSASTYSILLLNLQMSSANRSLPSLKGLYQGLSDLVKESEIIIYPVGDEDTRNVVVELSAPSAKARRAYTSLASRPTRTLVNGIKYESVQWWPTGLDYADAQLFHRQEMIEEALEMRRKEKEAERELERLRKEQEKILRGVNPTAWDDEDEHEYNNQKSETVEEGDDDDNYEEDKEGEDVAGLSKSQSSTSSGSNKYDESWMNFEVPTLQPPSSCTNRQ